MNEPRISIITVNLNDGPYLERALCSVLDQGYENLELLVADGGSDDESKQILDIYRDELTWQCSEPDASIPDAINKALAHATGDIIAILPSTAIYLPGTLFEIARHMTHTDQPQWLVGNCQKIGPHDELQGSINATTPKSLTSMLMHNSGCLPIATTFFNREIIRQFGGFNTQFPHAWVYEFNCRLIANDYQPQILNQLLTAIRNTNQIASATKTIAQGLQTIAAAAQFTNHLPLAHRYALWSNFEKRREIYAMAQSEIKSDNGRKFLWQQLLRHPWWLTHKQLRKRLVQTHATRRHAA